MDIIYAVIAFVVFSLLSDAIEGRRKKRRKAELPPTADKQSQAPQKPQTTIIIPPIKGVPNSRQNDSQTMPSKSIKAERKVDPRYAAALSQQPGAKSKEVAAPLAAVSQNRQAADIHTDVLLHAIEYAQILQPPKAYQYMATRSCRGDWQNNK